MYCCRYKNVFGIRGAWLARLEEHVTLDHKVLSLSPMLGIERIKKKFFLRSVYSSTTYNGKNVELLKCPLEQCG